jgi:hypothetical protein
LRVEHPTPEREAEIVALRTPDSGHQFHSEMAGLAKALRGWSLEEAAIATNPSLAMGSTLAKSATRCNAVIRV